MSTGELERNSSAYKSGSDDARPVVAPVRFLEAANSFLSLSIILVVLAIASMWIGDGYNRIAMLIAINMIAVIGTSVYTGNSGILTLAHIAFFAIGAYATGLVTTAPELKQQFVPELPGFLISAHLNVWGGIAVAMLTTLVLGAATALPISRLRDTSAIVATFGLLVITHYVLIGARAYTNGNKAFYGVPNDVNLTIVIVLLLVVLAVAFLFKESKYGLQLRAMRENELAAKAMGVAPNRRLFLAWVLSAVIMGVAGALFAHTLGAFSPRNFYLIETFALIAMLIVGGIRSISGAVFGTLLISFLMELIRPVEAGFDLAGLSVPPLWGLAQISLSLVILLVMYVRPSGLMGSSEFQSKWIANMLSGIWPGDKLSETSRQSVPSGDGGLSVAKVGKRFGGLEALKDVSLQVEPGQIVGLIGPNGAGKTTLINVITGVLSPTEGSVSAGSTQLDGRAVHAVALSGLARTFQNIRLFADLSVLENVMIAASTHTSDRQSLEHEAMGYLQELGLAEFSDQKAGALAYGNQRKLEIARALSLKPRFLLLDEPAAGMNSKESSELLELLLQIRTKFGVGILIVEHDLHLIMRLCDYIYVLNKGELIASGQAKEIQENPQVIEAYLGSSYKAND